MKKLAKFIWGLDKNTCWDERDKITHKFRYCLNEFCWNVFQYGFRSKQLKHWIRTFFGCNE